MNKQRIVPGINDTEFIRGEVPMTKEEIRTLSISKMNLNPTSRIIDIGAGTGSVSIECGLLADKGFVTAYEKNEEAVQLVKLNSKKFELKNIKIIKGTAPECIETDEKADAVFIGGSSGNINEILKTVYPLLNPVSRVVINATLIETFTDALKGLEKNGYSNIEYMQVQINRSKKLGKGNSLEPVNPVFIIWGER